MLRKLITLLMVLSLSWTTVACGSSSSVTQSPPNRNVSTSAPQTRLADGQYPVQQASYNDANGEYSLFLLNASPAVFNTTDLKMAQLTDAEIANGQKTYLQVNGGEANLHMSQDFKIEYVHAVTETQTNPQTGQQQTVVVRRESSFWTPFAGALAGQVVGNMLFAPRYYVPPVYQPGIILTGYGGHGSTYNQAVQGYQSRYQAPPPAVQNRRNQLRTTGRINSNRPATSNRPSSRPSTSNRPTGSGVGSSNLKSSGQSRPRQVKPGSGFGSGGRSPRPARSGSRGRRR
ncbi:hypothetical protein [Microcoleus sp. FACHB-68]|uniref:hypothetical protein n=1 Tax=Microcoleus sp. FACHB-68 TaxID=2692826 RepID=UPI001688A9E6|nr:hypothetical protein [Microcoleus sp. FACHB-68]MBD1937220.1 hypothetical protein [Microcoleus sp. FACHB-68]